MSEVSSQCQGCYEKFTSLGNHIPRLLNCQHILCSECIERELYEDTFYCPFCFQELKGSIDEIAPIYLDVCDKEEEGQQQQQQQQQGEEQIGNNERNSIDNNGDKPRTSSLSLFTQENPNMSISLSPTSSLSIKSPDDRGSRVSDPFKFGECKEPNCQNKACASHGYCLNHSTRKKHSVLEESKIANALANTPLDFMSVEGNNLLLRESTHIWPEVVPSELIDRFRHQKRLEMGEAIDLINRAKIILSREPNILYLDAPVIAVGDIHGQFYDLLNILEVGGEVGKGDHYLFLGDYVDRGSFSCEVILTLLAFKVIYPDRVWLIRGNHECASVSGHFGFKEECKMKYGVQVYYSFLLLFQSLPLAAVIKTSFGQIFACHGGLSPTVETLEDLSKIYRFVEPEENSSLLDILWSDPINEEATDEMTDAEYEEFISIEWKPNPSRGCSYFYGFQAVNKFLEKNNLLCIIRAHEVQELGFHKHFDPSMISNRLNHSQKMKNSRRITSAILSPHRQFQPDALALPKSPMIEQSSTRKPFTLNHEDTLNFDSDPGSNDMFECEIDIPSVITVFSAPNYCDRYANKGAILKIDVDLYGFRVLQYDCVEHPKPEITESQMNNHILTVIAICPYMPTSFRDFVRLAIELGPEDNLIEDDEVYEVKISNEISTSTGITSENGEKNEVMTSIQVNNEINEQKSILTTPQKTVHVNTEKNQKNQNITIESTTPKCVLWQSIDDNDNDDDHNKAPTIESPEIKKMFQSDSLSSVEKENMFSPQEVRKRSSSMKKAGGSTEISVITRTGSHGFSFSAEDLPSASSPRSPEFSLSSTRNRSQSERGFGHHPLRRLSSGARLEGTAKAALELAKLDENIVSPIKDSLPPSSSFDTTNDSQKPARRSSAHGSYVSRYKTQVLRSSTYTQALASDAINELHPDQLARFMKNIQPGSFKLSDQEKPNISFSTLKERFEKKNTEANHYISVARQELMEYSQSIERGRVNSVSSLREKFDRKARENAERHHAETRKNKFRKRSASLEPSPLGEETKSPTEKSSKKDEPKEFRGRRSRRLSVESYFDVEKSTPIRAHSLSPVPPSTSSRIEKRTTQLPSSSSSLLSSSSSLIEDKFDVNNSPPRQRAMALIYKPERIDLNHNHNHDNSHNNTNTYHNSKSNQNISTNNNLNEKKSDNSPHKSTLHHHSTDKNNENIASSAPKVRTEYEFLMTYKPDNENKVHFTMRELLALRLLFSLFDRSGCAVIGYEDLVAYGEETGGLAGIRDAAAALEIVDIDGDGKIGLLDFIHFAARLQLLFQRNLMKRVLDELLMNATASNSI